MAEGNDQHYGDYTHEDPNIEKSRKRENERSDKEARRHEATKLFEPIMLLLDQSDKEIKKNTDSLLEINNQMRNEMRLKISCIVNQSRTDPKIELMQIEGCFFLACYTSGRGLAPPLSSIEYYGGGVFYGHNCPHNEKVQMASNVRHIFAAEMVAIANALEGAHQVVDDRVRRLLLVVDNIHAAELTKTLTTRGLEYSNSQLMPEVMSDDRAIQEAIRRLLARLNRWDIIEIKHVHSQTGGNKKFSRGNRDAKHLATEACKDNWIPK